MHDLWSAVSKNKVLERVLPILPPSSYLVGGCVRDFLLGREPQDFDIVTYTDVWHLALQIEDILEGKAFWIDRERQVARVACRKGELTMDVSPPRGPDITSDLSQRDITINALAYDTFSAELIDPLKGLSDLRKGIVRIISEDSLKDDPLRGIRALRFAIQFGFDIAGETLSLIRAYAATIHRVSPERIKQEFLKALTVAEGSSFFRLMADTLYVEELFGHVHGLDPFSFSKTAIERSLMTCREVDSLLFHVHTVLSGIGGYFSQEVEHGFSRAAVLRLSAFLAGIYSLNENPEGEGLQKDSPESPRLLSPAERFCRRLSLSLRAARNVDNTISGYREVLALADKQHIAGKDMYRLFRSFPECIPEILLLAEASSKAKFHAIRTNQLCTGLKPKIALLWSYYRETYLLQKGTPLITGNDIMRAFPLTRGPMIGECLEQVEEARSDGLIKSREEAIAYVRAIISKGFTS
jgi:tRNA nucleotidyltransferase (CCA-adding enzyme)